MKKYVLYLCLCLCLYVVSPTYVYAHPGRTDASGCHTCRTNCAKWGLRNGQYHCHNGNSSSNSSGGSSAATKSYIYGCTDIKADNYNALADKDDGSCIYKIMGCTDQTASNFNDKANTEDGTCQYEEVIEETKELPYKTILEDNSELKKGLTKVKQQGKKGKSVITYKIMKDAQGKQLSKTKIKEEKTVSPVNELVYQGTYVESSPWDFVIFLLWLGPLIFNFYFLKKDHDHIMLLSKMKDCKYRFAKYLLYFIYVIFIIPVWIDFVMVLVHYFTKNKNSK